MDFLNAVPPNVHRDRKTDKPQFGHLLKSTSLNDQSETKLLAH